MDVQKSPKGPPFYIFRHYATYRRLKKNFGRKIGKTSHFFSLFRHSATFRQKIFRKETAFLFSVLRQNGCWKIPKCPPFSFFGNWDFSFFSPKCPPSIFYMICDRRDENCQSVPLARQSGPTFGFLGSLERILWHFEVLLLILSLRYGADLGSRLVFYNFRSVCGHLVRFWCTCVFYRNYYGWYKTVFPDGFQSFHVSEFD